MIDTTDQNATDRCSKEKSCGHRCLGVANEQECLPCLDEACLPSDCHLPRSDELCAICYTSELREQACVKLQCGHVYHEDCIVQLLSHKWSTLQISFAFMSCPSCKAEINETQSQQIVAELAKLRSFRDQIHAIALDVAKNQGLDKDERLTKKGDFY